MGPLPGLNLSLTVALPVPSADTTKNRLTISGFHVTGPIDLGHELHFAFEGVHDTGPSVNRRFFYWQRCRHFSDNSMQTILAIDPTLMTTGVDGEAARPCWFDNYRADDTDPLMPGLPVVVAAWFEQGGGFSRVWRVFPSLTAAPGGTTVINEGVAGPPDVGYDPSIGFTHQGRSFICDQGSYLHGSGPTDVWTHNERIVYTDANLTSLATTDGVTFGAENATGYMAAISTSFAELFMVKVGEGGLLLRGDISFPTVIRLPGIPTMGSLHHKPCTTPVGVVFLTENGPYLWSGAENADPIAEQAIDPGDFLLSPGGDVTDFIDHFGRLYYWFDWVFFPNNWVWNWRQQSWWRLDDPEVVQLFHLGPSLGGRLYAAPANVETDAPACYGYDRGTPAQDWKWTSQPMPIMEDRQFVIREMVYVVSGTGDLTFEHYHHDGTTETHTVTVASENKPVYIRQNGHVRCQDIKLSIEADGLPIVHEVRFGLQVDTHYPYDTP